MVRKSNSIRTRDEVARARHLMAQVTLHPGWFDVAGAKSVQGYLNPAMDTLDWVLNNGTRLFASLLEEVEGIVQEQEALAAVRAGREKRRRAR